MNCLLVITAATNKTKNSIPKYVCQSLDDIYHYNGCDLLDHLLCSLQGGIRQKGNPIVSLELVPEGDPADQRGEAQEKKRERAGARETAAQLAGEPVSPGLASGNGLVVTAPDQEFAIKIDQ